MKRILLVAALAALVFSCSKNEETFTETQEDLTIALSSDLSIQKPLKKYDNSEEGLYAGVIVANETNFHGKLWVNMGNDGNFYAIAETIEGQKIKFDLKDTAESVSQQTFINDRGSFDIDLSNFTNPVISNVSIDGTAGNAKVVKETSNAKVKAVLGTFDDQALAGFTGTWDFLVDSATVDIIEIIITTTAGQMNTDVQADFEAVNTGCYNSGELLKPFFFQDLDPAINNYEMYSVGQEWVLPNGMTILYDFGFSKNILDANGYDYTYGAFNPVSTNGIFFDPPLDPNCWIIDANGLYAVINAAGDAYVSAGKINLDTSGLIPVPEVNSLKDSKNLNQAPASKFNNNL